MKNHDLDKFVLRMPEGMREQIKQLSEKQQRSMNSQLVFMVDYYLKNVFEATVDMGAKLVSD